MGDERASMHGGGYQTIDSADDDTHLRVRAREAARKRMTLDRGRLPDFVFAAACLLAMGAWLWMGSGLTFLLDEWTFIQDADDWSIDALMAPLNSHWSLGLKLMWNSLMATVGMQSYMPYLFVANILHVAIAAGIYVYARRQTIPLVAVATGVVFLFLGSGVTNMLLGIQMNFNLAAAAGTWALVILLREPGPKRAPVAAVLLVVAVATNGVGLFFVAAATATVILSPARRRLWWVVFPAVLAFGAWYVVYGREDAVVLPAVAVLVPYAFDGIGNAVGQVTGLGREIGLVVYVLLGLAALGNLASVERLRLGLFAGLTGLTGGFVLFGLARAALEPASFAAGRFVHVAAVFVLIAFIGWLGHRSLGRPGERFRVVVAVAVLAVLALSWNVGRAINVDAMWRARAAQTRAAFTLLLEYGGTPALPAERGFGYTAARGLAILQPGQREWVPGSAEFSRLVARYGSPLQDPLAPRGVAIPDVILDGLFARTVADSVTVGVGVMPTDPSPIIVEARNDVTTDPAGQCLTVDVAGPDPYLDVAIPAGSSLYAQAETAGRGEVSVSLRGTYPVPGPSLELTAEAVIRVAIPDVGDDRAVRVRFVPPPAGSTLVCLAQKGAE